VARSPACHRSPSTRRRRSRPSGHLFPRARVTSLVFFGFFYQLIDVPAVIVLGFWFVLQVIDGLTSLDVTQGGGGVAFFAHIGGFVAGAIAARVAVSAAGRLGGSATPRSVG